jgi:hypothetical protein
MAKDPVDDAIETILDDKWIDDLNGGEPTDGWGDV